MFSYQRQYSFFYLVNILLDELYLALVVSSKAHAEIVDVVITEALSEPGVVDYITHKDVPGSNISGHIQLDEEIFATKTVSYYQSSHCH